ncbi:MAG: AI-2E family transporter [Candidatus Acidiferrales bacterium]
MAEKTILQRRLGSVLFYGFIALLAYFVYLVFLPFLVPLCWAAVLVVVFDPLNRLLKKRLGKTWAAMACTLLVMLLLIVPAIGVGMAFVHQGFEAAGAVEHGINDGGFVRVNRAWAWLAAHVPGQTAESFSETLHRAIEAVEAFLASQIGVVLRNAAIFIFDLAVTLLAMFYLFRDNDELMERVRQVLPFERASREEMLGKSRDLIFASVTSALVTALLHGLAAGLAFAIVGIAGPVFWGVSIAFLSLLPVVGDMVIWIPAMIDLIVTGHWGKAIFLAIVLGAVVAVADNVIRPWFISGRAQLSGLVVFISVIGGMAVFGLLGIVLGPIVVATAAGVLELYAHGRPRVRNETT